MNSEEKYYIINRRDIMMRPLCCINKENGSSKIIEFTYTEAINTVKEMNNEEKDDLFYCISVSDWIKERDNTDRNKAIHNRMNEMHKFMKNIDIDSLLPKELLEKKQLYEELQDKNINGFELPIEIDYDNEYLSKLKEILRNYYKYINNKKAFEEYNVAKDIQELNDKIIKAIEEYYLGNISSAQDIIFEIIKNCIDKDKYSFFMNELDKSYAFRGIAPFLELQSEECDYNEQANYELSFFKARKDTVNDRKDMVHIPLDMRSRVTTQRFSIAGLPCIYMGTTSYVCWLELLEPKYNEFNVSAFKFNDSGKKLKILNLVISQALINGMCSIRNKSYKIEKELQREMLKIWPLVCATSFRVTEKNRNFKSEYIVSQLIMMNLRKLNIDGVAYLSKRVFDEFQYPQSVNIALPVFDITGNRYGSICEDFDLTLPSNLDEFSKIKEPKIATKSYINQCFSEGFSSKINFNNENKAYSETIFSDYDNYLVNKEYDNYKNK